MTEIATLILPAWLTPAAADHLAAAALRARAEGRDTVAAVRDAALAIMPAAPWPVIEAAVGWAAGAR